MQRTRSFCAAVAIIISVGIVLESGPGTNAASVSIGHDARAEYVAIEQAAGDAAAIEFVVVGRQRDLWLWITELKRQAAERAAAAAASSGGGSCDRPVDYGTYGPGGYSGDPSLPPGETVARESNGNYGSCNESSGACGRYQFLDSTWNNYGGYSSACDAPPAVQDQKARETWAGGAGCSHWSAC